MKTLAKIFATAFLVAGMAAPATAAGSKAYCAQKARNVANTQAVGKTVVGAGVGCLLGVVIAHKCGVGAAVGGVTGFAIGGSKWKQVYNNVYYNCRHS